MQYFLFVGLERATPFPPIGGKVFNHCRPTTFPAVRGNGSLIRFRPVIMTTLTTLLGLMPLLLSHGTGAEVQRPLAAVVVFGLTTSTLLTLFVLPSIYEWMEVRLGKRNFQSPEI